MFHVEHFPTFDPDVSGASIQACFPWNKLADLFQGHWRLEHLLEQHCQRESASLLYIYLIHY